MKSIDGISYPWSLYLEDQLMEIKLSCGGETLTIVPTYKESFKINNYEVAKVIEWPTKFSYLTTKKEIKFEDGDPTSVIQQRYQSDITMCPPYKFTLYLDNELKTQFTSSSQSVYLKDGSTNEKPQFEIDRTAGLNNTFYMKIRTQYNAASFVVVPIWFKVCGYETIDLSDPDTVPLHHFDSNSGSDYSITNTIVQSYYVLSTNDTDCQIVGYELKDFEQDSFGVASNQIIPIGSFIVGDHFLDAGPTNKRLDFSLKITNSDQYLGNITFTPKINAISAGNLRFPRSLNITINKMRTNCESASLVLFDQLDLDVWMMAKYPKTKRTPQPNLPPFQEDDLSWQYPKFVFNNPRIMLGAQDLDATGFTCNYNNRFGVGGKREGIINYVIHDPDLNIRKYHLYDMNETSLELKTDAVPYQISGCKTCQNDTFLSLGNTYEKIDNETSYSGFERKFGEDYVTKNVNYLAFSLGEPKQTRSGWYIMTLKSSFYVDNPTSSYKLITIKRDYKFFIDFCQVSSYEDTSGGRAFGNKTIIQYLWNYGQINMHSPFKDILKIYPDYCDEQLGIVIFFDKYYIVEDEDSVLTGEEINALEEFYPSAILPFRTDDEGLMIRKTEKVPVGENYKVQSINRFPSLFRYDQQAQNFTIYCEGKPHFGLYKVHMWSYPKLWREGITYLKENVAISPTDEDWKYERGISLTEHRKDWIFYLNVSYDPLGINEVPHFATTKEGGFELKNAFIASEDEPIENYKFPKIKNKEKSETVNVVLTTEAILYVEYSQSDNALIFKERTKEMTKTLRFEVVLKDNNKDAPASKTYEFLILCLYCNKVKAKRKKAIRIDGPSIEAPNINFNDLVPEGEQAQPPQMLIKPISSLGVLTLEFSKNMDFPKELVKKYTSDKKEWKKIYDTLMSSDDDQKRQLMKFKDKSFGTNLINFEVLANNPDDQDKMKIQSYLVNLQPSRMEFQVYFENPKIISLGSQDQKDQLEITLSNDIVLALKDDQQGLPLDLSNYGNNLKISKGLPAQMEISLSSGEMVENMKDANTGMKFMVILNFGLSFLITFSLNFLWSMINCLQMIVYLPLFNITLPANVNTLFTILIEVATFDIIPESDKVSQFIFGFKYSKQLIKQQSFESIGYETKNFIINLGSLFLFQAVFMVQLLTIGILRQIAPRHNFLIYWYRKIKLKSHIYAILIRFVLEGFVELFLGALLNMELLSQIDLMFLNLGDFISFVLSTSYFLFILILPMLVAIKISQKIDFLENKINLPLDATADHETALENEEKQFDKKWDSLYDSLKQDDNLQLQYYYIYLLRRMIFTLIAYYLHEYPGIQIQLNNFMMLLLLMYLTYSKPFKQHQININEIVNESMIMCIGNSLYCITDWISSVDTKVVAGNFIMYTTLLNIFYNVTTTARELFRMALIEYNKKRYIARLREQKKVIMKKFTIRQGAAVKRAIASRDKITGKETISAQHYSQYDRKMRRRFQQQNIPDYELSDIPEEEGPEHACTEFDRRDGKYLALEKDQNVIAAAVEPSKLTKEERLKIRHKLEKRQEKAFNDQDEANTAAIKKMKQVRQKQIEENKEIQQRKTHLIELKQSKRVIQETLKQSKQRETQIKSMRRQKKKEEQARKSDLKMLLQM